MGKSLNYGKGFLVVLFISYCIFLTTNGLGNLKYGNNKNLNFMEKKFEEIENKYSYLINNMSVGNIEDNNREILYLEELKEEILEKVNKEGEFWLVDLKNIINQKETSLIKDFVEDGVKYNKVDYLKLKNEIDEYNMYYGLGKKPIEYSESMFIKYFEYIFNSRSHQIFFTMLIFIICFTMINPNSDFNKGFFSISLTIIGGTILIQVISLLVWGLIDKNLDLLYPIRILNKIDFKNIFSGYENEAVLPLYKVILYTFVIESIYIVFIVSFVKIIDLIFSSILLKITSVFSFLCLMIGLEFTKYSSFSFLSYGKFLNVLRGYETIYNGSEFLNIGLFLICSIIMLLILSITYFYKKYILNDIHI